MADTNKDEAKLEAWRASKLAEWEQPESKLRQKLPSRQQFDAWADKQCLRAKHNAATARAGGASRTSQPGQPVVRLEDVRFTHTRYGRTPVLHGLSMELRRAEVVGVFGLNEAGKTTVARIIEGSLKPDSGTLEIGPPGPAERRNTWWLAAIVLALGLAGELARRGWLAGAGLLVGVSVAVGLAWWWRRGQRPPGAPKVVLITSEDAPGAIYKPQQA